MIGTEVKVLKIKTSIYYDNKGAPLRVLGVDIDMSMEIGLVRQNEALHQERSALESKQRQEIFKTILSTQQAERKRIAENLHNGLGQFLYAVKLNLSKNILDSSFLCLSEHQHALQETEEMLTDAIRESRKLSHQLMPTVLEDFGLEAALDDIKEQLQMALEIETLYTGLQYKMDKHLEIAVYRIVQELLMNVVKHAKASKAFIGIEADSSSIKISVRDNGKGFNVKQQFDTGIGLRTIRNKANLLDGSLNIHSETEKGTIISITIPNRASA
jgi:two-component system NarL family sensor kinase